jgi:hypothetical protein
VKDPLLQERAIAFVRLNGAGVAYPAWRFTAEDGGPEIRRSLRLGDDLITIDWPDGRVPIAMEDNGRNRGPAVPT